MLLDVEGEGLACQPWRRVAPTSYFITYEHPSCRRGKMLWVYSNCKLELSLIMSLNLPKDYGMSENISCYIKTTISEDEKALFTSHFVQEVLPGKREFKNLKYQNFLDLVNDPELSLKTRLAASKELKETNVEVDIIRPVLDSLGVKTEMRVSIPNGEIDMCAYIPESEKFAPNGFDQNFSNTYFIVEAKRHGRLRNKYFINKNNNSDAIYQLLTYLRHVSLQQINGQSSTIANYALLTDGYLWRIYSRKNSHNDKLFESRFIEFNLEEIVNCEDQTLQEQLLKIFAFFFSPAVLLDRLNVLEEESAQLETVVTTSLREQTFIALEYIATGLWRQVHTNPNLKITLQSKYSISISATEKSDEEKNRLLKLIYEESLVFLLRTLFVLYAEDRNLFSQESIGKSIKGKGNILERISRTSPTEIGQISAIAELQKDDDISLAKTFKLIDQHYNGGLFSSEKHPLLYMLDIEDDLYANAIDNLCRVQVKKSIHTVDFSTISARELGSIYESLLEYKLTVAEQAMAELPSIVNKKRIRKNVLEGDLYLINHKGERKSTGSYYTPDLIVNHIVKKSLDPKLEEILSASDGFDEIYAKVLELSVCDPAMGSGHMVFACFNRIIEFLRQVIEESQEAGDVNVNWDAETSYEIRAAVARKCIYGADLNPTAVELAKLVMWMSIFNADKPFEFFDYNLTCGNSLIGLNEETEHFDMASQNISTIFGQAAVASLLPEEAEVEASIHATLVQRVHILQNMPRQTVEQVHAVDDYWQIKVLPLQKDLSFVWNVKLAQLLLTPGVDNEAINQVSLGYPTLIELVDEDPNYIEKVVRGDIDVPASVRKLLPIAQLIEDTYRPIHWRVMFPHIMMNGGFDVVCANPPWDKVKGTRGEFFSDYIDGYDKLGTKQATALSNALKAENPAINQRWVDYDNSYKRQNVFYAEQYNHQVILDSNGKKLSGDNNLYKIFLEKIYTLLKQGGACGIVVPDNFNLDNGCSGLRKLLIDKASIREIIMFENRKKLFEIHGQYKFNVMVFDKKEPRKNHSFVAGFYWYDPIWLDGKPEKEYWKKDSKNAPSHHRSYKYSAQFIRETAPDTYTIFEFKNEKQRDVYKQLSRFPVLSNSEENFYAGTYREFDMTNDSDLFVTSGEGWPLYQGGMIHHYDACYADSSYSINSSEGEARLSKKWKLQPQKLPNRDYRIGWRSIAQPTDTRSLLTTVIPKGVFVGNSINLFSIYAGTLYSYKLLSGINVVLSSMTADFYIRQRIAKNVNAFIVKDLPFPRELSEVECLGALALPLYSGHEFEKFRDGVNEITDAIERKNLTAKLDAMVAHLYLLTYEQYQTVLSSFPLVEESYRNRCLFEFKEIQLAR